MKLLQFKVLLAPLHALICEVEREHLWRGRLLYLLHAKCHCGSRAASLYAKVCTLYRSCFVVNSTIQIFSYIGIKMCCKCCCTIFLNLELLVSFSL